MQAIRLIIGIFIIIELMVGLFILLSRRIANPWKKVDIEELRSLT